MALRPWRKGWRKGLSELFKKDASREAQTPQSYLKLARKCMESAERMITSQSVSKSLQFNHGQCEYLANKLNESVQGAEVWASPTSSEINLASVDIMKLLWRSAKEVESFIEGCCRENWIQAAMMLANMSEHVSQLSADLEFCTLLILNRCNPLAAALTEFESGFFYKPKSVEEIVARDQSTLLTKLETVKSSKSFVEMNGNRRKLSDQESQLAKCLSSRLIQHLLGSVELGVWEIHYSKLRPGQRLGAGASGWVRKSIWMGKEVAEKVFQGADHPSFKNEVGILAGLAHPNIVPLLGYAEDGNRCFIVMELMDGDLSSLMEERLRHKHTCKVPFSDFEAVDMMLQTAEGMRYLHENKVVHRDLKSHNILVKSRKDIDAEYVYAKVADFGLAKTKEGSSSYSNLTVNTGTTRWMPPELMPSGEDALCAMTSDHDRELRYPFKVDIYSFGMVCYEILTGEVPFSTISDPKEVKKMVLNGDRPELPDNCSHVLKKLICSCWEAEPSRRPSFVEICKRLRYLKYSIMRGSGSLKESHDPAEIFESIRALTSNFTKMEAINGSRTMFRASKRDAGFVAVKKFEVWGSYGKRKVRQQALRISKLDHKNVLKTIGCWLEGQVHVVAYEYAALGSLYDVLHGKVTGVLRGQNAPVLTWMQRVKIAVGVARGLEFLHGQTPPIIHGNIKSSNILMFDDDVAKIGDFEFTPRYKFPGSDIRAHWAVETVVPCAPELNLIGKKCSQECDIYAFGVLLLELLTGENVNDYKVALAIGDYRRYINYCEKGCAKVAETAALCLQCCPQDRPSSHDLVENLQPFLRVRRV